MTHQLTQSQAAAAAAEAYNPNRLLDAIIGAMHLKNDAALSRFLSVAPPVISKLRHHRLPIGASLLIRIHEETDMPIREIKALAGMA